MKKRAIWLLVLALVLIVAAYDAISSEPTYRGLSIEGFNYTPYNLDRFVIRDKYGNAASGGGDLMPGAGQGSLSCCYKLKGTDFTIDWYAVDQDEFLKNIYAPLNEIHKVTQVHLSPTEVEGSAGMHILGLHFYPDDHIEFEFRNDLQGTRIEYAEIDDWLVREQGKTFDPHSREDAAAFRRTARIAATGWLKYRFTDTRDLDLYVYYTLLVNPKFDEHPAVQKILSETKDKPGVFGAAMEALPAPIVEELKTGKFEHVQPSKKNTNDVIFNSRDIPMLPTKNIGSTRRVFAMRLV